jgi:drug/metabolite transporter (DMT)-like permease
MRIASPEFGPVVLVELRVIIAALVLLPVLLIRENLASLSQNWRKLVFLGVVNSAIPFYLFSYSTLTLTAGYASILNATAPMFAAAIAWLWLSQKLAALQSAGIVIGIVGVTVLAWPELSFGIDGAAIAIAAGLLASFCYGIAANYTKEHVGNLSSLSIATGSMLAASLFLLPGAVIYWPQQAVSANAWISVIALGILSTGFAYILYFRLIRHVGPAKAITVTYLLPVFAVFWGAIVLSEAVSLAMVVGAAIIFTGTALATGIVSKRKISD